jgi:hypothetical protein
MWPRNDAVRKADDIFQNRPIQQCEYPTSWKKRRGLTSRAYMYPRGRWAPNGVRGNDETSKNISMQFQKDKINTTLAPTPALLSSPHTIMTAAVTSAMESYQTQLVNDSLTAGALKFGSFTLKSGRYDHFTLIRYR